MAQAWMVRARRRRTAFQDRRATGELRWAASEALADWLATFAWDHFGTGTVAPPAGEESILRSHRWWTRELDARQFRQARQVVFLERHKSGWPHLHWLSSGTAGVSHDWQEGLWSELTGGIARVKIFGADRLGAVEYIVKCCRYVSKEGNGPWLLGPWPRGRGG